MSKVSILVFDDDDLTPTILRRTTRRSAFEIDFAFAHTAEDLPALLAAGRYDFALCDSRIPPFVDFRESVPALRDAGFNGPVVVISAHIGANGAAGARALDIDEVIDRADLDCDQIDRLIRRFAVDPARSRARPPAA